MRSLMYVSSLRRGTVIDAVAVAVSPDTVMRYARRAMKAEMNSAGRDLDEITGALLDLKSPDNYFEITLEGVRLYDPESDDHIPAWHKKE